MKVKLMNKIAQVGLDQFKPGYECDVDFDDYDAIMVRSAKLHDVEFAKNCKCIARAGAGVNNIPLDRCSEEGIVVFNTPGANANAVKELVICGLILAGRKISKGIEWVKTIEDDDVSKAVEKGKSNFVGPEIAGKTLGVIGLGAIGVKVANAASALGMKVYGYDPYISVDAAWTLATDVKHAKDLEKIYDKCDYITIHVPFMESTKNMINEEALNKCKDGVRILNFARGGLVDEKALKEALDNGKVACYVTDFPNEDLINHENVISLPHLGASTPESEDNCAVMAAKEIQEYLENGNIVNSVNLPNVQAKQEYKTRICIINRNIPEVISKLSTLLGQIGINIENMISKAKQNYAYTILETDNEVSDEIITKINEAENIIYARKIEK